MANFNKVMIMGNITRDIELRYTPKGTAVADITVASNRFRTGDDGRKIEEATFVDVTLWGRQAELANQYLGKGRPVFIEGRLAMDSWVDQQTGKNRTKLKVVGEQMQFIGNAGSPNASGGSGGSNTGNPNAGARPANPSQQQPAQQGGSPAAPPANMPEFVDEDDDIPF